MDFINRNIIREQITRRPKLINSHIDDLIDEELPPLVICGMNSINKDKYIQHHLKKAYSNTLASDIILSIAEQDINLYNSIYLDSELDKDISSLTGFIAYVYGLTEEDNFKENIDIGFDLHKDKLPGMWIIAARNCPSAVKYIIDKNYIRSCMDIVAIIICHTLNFNHQFPIPINFDSDIIKILVDISLKFNNIVYAKYLNNFC